MTVNQATLDSVRAYRLRRVREEMAVRDIGSIVLVDPVNVRYATDTRNMQIFSARNPARYVFIPLEGPVVMFEFAGCAHLSAHSASVDEVRTATTASYVASAQRLPESVQRWADEIGDLARTHGNLRVGLERFNVHCGFALRKMGFDVVDAQEPVERARAVKSDDEITLMRESAALTMHGVNRLQASIRPGISETALWAELWHEVIARGGDYIETRLLSSGTRTNPWFQEASEKSIEAGELISLDTDVVGAYGYYCDFSRSFVCGGDATGAQKELYRLAYDQIHQNMSLIRPGVTFAELSEQGWRIPEAFFPNRYYLMAHGIGMTGEYPYILYWNDHQRGGYDGVVEKNMVLCVESYIGSKDGGEGVKLEQQLRVVDNGVELMTDYPFDDDLLTVEM
ncbi:MAG: Xaa-Pro peptidase family protein [Gammaproteobacteria bacterium]|nr:Xaa-Pro peptidase family protein [Gammaproteobacteria bacterium]